MTLATKEYKGIQTAADLLVLPRLFGTSLTTVYGERKDSKVKAPPHPPLPPDISSWHEDSWKRHHTVWKN